MEIIYTSDGTYNAPRGVRGGLDGAKAQQFRRSADGKLEALANFSQIKIAPGETVVSMCTGGGGYGRPDERDIHLVAKDVAEGWVSRRRAEAVYRVAFDDDGALDEAATRRLRAGEAA